MLVSCVGILLFNVPVMCNLLFVGTPTATVNAGGGGGGGFFQSIEYAKGSVSLNRTRASTMLRPAELERKMARIAAKPPAPGAAAADA
jgi:hypothetical protein